MWLKSFRVQNYRSINDSGDIDVGQLTAFVGRNESGKSNLLRALHNLNPSDDSEVLDINEDFPRQRKSGDCSDTVATISTVWELNDEEQKAIGELCEQCKAATTVRIDRYYDAPLVFDFEGEVSEEFDFTAIKNYVQKFVSTMKKDAAKFNEDARAQIEGMAEKFEADMISISEASDDGEDEAKLAIETLYRALDSVDTGFAEAQKSHIAELEKLAEEISGDMDSRNEACQWVKERLPIFMYLEEYPELNGKQNIVEFLQRKRQDNLTLADKNFEKMCKVAGLEPEKLYELYDNRNSAARNQLANHASRKITDEIQRLWKNERLKIRFDLDAEDINTFISSPKDNYNAEINLNERSRGLKWFFSFYIAFAADTKGGDAKNAILLLDEPGLHLHANAQRDLLNHFENDFKNHQILYTTHSPFMVPTHKLDVVRTVMHTKEDGATVSNDLSGDTDTLFPLQAALGYDLAQSLFIGPNNLIVEGPTDFWALSSISEYLNGTSRDGLKSNITITPAGGAQKIPYMVNLLSSEKLNVVTLLDHEKDARGTQTDLVKSKLIKEKDIISISAAFGSSPPKEADIEDLLDPKVYEDLVYESYKKELEKVSLEPNDNIPRIAKRFEYAFKDAGLQFEKTRPMRLLLDKMGTSQNKIVTDAVAKRFETLFRTINDRFPKS